MCVSFSSLSFFLASLNSELNLQTHIVVFGKCLAERKGEYDQHQVGNADDNDANDQLPLPYQPLSEDLIAALRIDVL